MARTDLRFTLASAQASGRGIIDIRQPYFGMVRGILSEASSGTATPIEAETLVAALRAELREVRSMSKVFAPEESHILRKIEMGLGDEVVEEMIRHGMDRESAHHFAYGMSAAAHRYTDALQFAKTLTRLSPTSAGAWGALGQAQYNLGHHEASLHALRRAHEIDPANAEVALLIADCHAALGDEKAAQKAAQLAAALGADTRQVFHDY